MKAVYKYPLMWLPQQSVLMTEGALVLSVGLQGSMPMAWALVDPEAQAAQAIRSFWIVPTGAPRSDLDGLRFLGRLTTAQHEEYHVFTERG